MTYEVESRGPLSRDDYARLKTTLDDVATFVEKKHRVLIDYSTFLASEGLRDRTRDIRIRNTNGVTEMITKIGSWGGNDSRKEIAVTTKASFDTVVQLYASLGYTKGILCARDIYVYTYKGAEIVIIDVPGHSYSFEIEIEVPDSAAEESARSTIDAILSELQLTTFSDDAFFAYIETLNKEANIVFDASIESETFFNDRFGV